MEEFKRRYLFYRDGSIFLLTSLLFWKQYFSCIDLLKPRLTLRLLCIDVTFVLTVNIIYCLEILIAQACVPVHPCICTSPIPMAHHLASAVAFWCLPVQLCGRPSTAVLSSLLLYFLKERHVSKFYCYKWYLLYHAQYGTQMAQMKPI